MTNSEIKARNERINTMASCWSVAVDLGFSMRVNTRGRAAGGYVHQSQRLSLFELDPETTWEIVLSEVYFTPLRPDQPVHYETGRVRLKCVSVDQFRVILSGLVSQVEG
jgi:hypothetical protein